MAEGIEESQMLPIDVFSKGDVSIPRKDTNIGGCEQVYAQVEGGRQQINNYYVYNGPVYQTGPHKSSSEELHATKQTTRRKKKKQKRTNASPHEDGTAGEPVDGVEAVASKSNSESGIFSGGCSERSRLDDGSKKDIKSKSQEGSRHCSKETGQASRRQKAVNAGQYGALNEPVEAIGIRFGLSQFGEELVTLASEENNPDCNCQVTPEVMRCGDTVGLKISCPLIAAGAKYSVVVNWKRQGKLKKGELFFLVAEGEVLPEGSGGTLAVYATVSALPDSKHAGFASLQLLPFGADTVKHNSVDFFFTKRQYVHDPKQDRKSSNDDGDDDNDGYDSGPNNGRDSSCSLYGDVTRPHSLRGSTGGHGNNSSSGSSNSTGRQSSCYPADLMQQYLTAEFLAYRLVQNEGQLLLDMIEDSVCGDSMKQWLDCDESLKSARNRVSSIYGLSKCPADLQYVICEKLLILCAGMACDHVSDNLKSGRKTLASDDDVHVLTPLDFTTESISEVSSYVVSEEQPTSQSDCEGQRTDSRFLSSVYEVSLLRPLDCTESTCKVSTSMYAVQFTSNFDGDDQKTDSRCLDDQQTALQLLRSQRRQLIDRLSPRMVRAPSDTLCEQHIMSTNEMEDIQSERTREGMARRLLFVMETRSWEECVEFVRLLSQTEGIKDLVKKLLENAGEAIHGFNNKLNGWLWQA